MRQTVMVLLLLTGVVGCRNGAGIGESHEAVIPGLNGWNGPLWTSYIYAAAPGLNVPFADGTVPGYRWEDAPSSDGNNETFTVVRGHDGQPLDQLMYTRGSDGHKVVNGSVMYRAAVAAQLPDVYASVFGTPPDDMLFNGDDASGMALAAMKAAQAPGEYPLYQGGPNAPGIFGLLPTIDPNDPNLSREIAQYFALMLGLQNGPGMEFRIFVTGEPLNGTAKELHFGDPPPNDGYTYYPELVAFAPSTHRTQDAQSNVAGTYRDMVDFVNPALPRELLAHRYCDSHDECTAQQVGPISDCDFNGANGAYATSCGSYVDGVTVWLRTRPGFAGPLQACDSTQSCFQGDGPLVCAQPAGVPSRVCLSASVCGPQAQTASRTGAVHANISGGGSALMPIPGCP